jgi:diacylglycerol kinase (ATP)
MKACLIHNPTAGPWDVRRSLRRVQSSLKRRGWSVQLQLTEKSGDAIALARAAAQDNCDAVIVAGGDGTINEAVNGTGNMWAKQLHIPTYTLTNPLRLREAAAGLAEGKIRVVDVGRMNNRYFLCWAGIGLDAQVTAEMEPRQRRTKRLGVLPYAIAAVLVARDFKGVRTRVSLDGGIVRSRTLLILVSNIQQYMGTLNVARDARMDDGLLDVFVFKGLGFPYAVYHLLRIISQRCLQDPRIVHRQARHIEIWTEPVTPVHVDGDPIGTTPVTLEAVPLALRVLVPPYTPPSLFTPAVQGETP